MRKAERLNAVDQEEAPLVLLPGTLCDERVFGPLRERWDGMATQVIMTPDATTLEEAACEVLAKAPARCILLGFSLGGLVALEAALQATERVRGLILLNTTPLPVPAHHHAPRRQAVAEASQLGLQWLLADRLWPEYSSTTADQGSLPLLQTMALSLGHEVFARQTEMALRRVDYRSRLHSIHCPVLVISGEADKLCSTTAQQELTSGLRNCTHIHLAGAGHLALLERADEVASAVAAWLHTVMGSRDRR